MLWPGLFAVIGQIYLGKKWDEVLYLDDFFCHYCINNYVKSVKGNTASLWNQSLPNKADFCGFLCLEISSSTDILKSALSSI